MNYIYLLVPGCYGYGADYNGLEKLEYSILSLKKNAKYGKIYVYSGYDDTTKDKLNEIENWCNNNDVIFINFGHLKHKFLSNKNNIRNNPYTLSILIEKLYILKNHNIDEEICFIDLDTEFNINAEKIVFDYITPILHAREYNMLGARNLKEFFNNILKFSVKDNQFMFNSGIIYIPKNKRVEIASKAIKLVIEMDKYPDTTRISNILDEQIAISIYIYEEYGNRINLFDKYVFHHWDKTSKNIKYWEQ